MTDAAGGGWSFDAARTPAVFSLAYRRGRSDVFHAYAPTGTLCGLRHDQIERYLGIFEPDDAMACPTCARRVAAAPRLPGEPERLHNALLICAPDPVRDALLDALRRGATVERWTAGSGGEYLAELGRIVEGRSAVAATLDVDARVGLAVVVDPPWRYVAVVPRDRAPAVGRGPA